MTQEIGPLGKIYGAVVGDIVAQAGVRIAAAYRAPLVIEHKGNDPRNEVTIVDREIGEWLTSALRVHFPDHHFYSEEQKNEAPIDAKSIPHLWTVDPIDGTSNFARHIPLFTTVVSLLVYGEPCFTVVHNPITQETFSFAKGEGVLRDGVRVQASANQEPKKSFALIRPGRTRALQPWLFKIVESFTEHTVAKVGNFGASAYDLALLASGSVDIVIYGNMTTADIAGAIGMVREAGGEVYTPLGIPVGITFTPQPIIAVASPLLFAQLQPFLFLELLPA